MMLALILGVVLIVVGVLGVLGLIGLSMPVSIVVIVAGFLLVLVGRGAWRR